MRLIQMGYLVALLLLMTTSVIADTKDEVIIDCDKNRTDDTVCVACNIYHESRGENPAGQLAVGLVTKNRVESNLYPNDYCETVWEVRRDAKTGKRVPMFSWTLDGKPDKVYNEKRWEMAVLLARQITKTENIHDFTVGSLWYHSVGVNPFWAKHYYPTVKVGNHQFYAAKEEEFFQTLLNETLPEGIVAALQD